MSFVPLSDTTKAPGTWLLAVALICLLATFTKPQLERQSSRYRALLVIDVTRSMNVRDYTDSNQAISRLDAIKRGIRQWLIASPCESQLGLAIFTSRQAFLLFEPLEICSNHAPIMAAVDAVNWRMAWQGDSGIAYGLNSAFELAQAVDADLVFLTDGQEAPPPPRSGPPRFKGKAGDVHGLLVGVGGITPAPIPEYDRDGREIGFLDASDVPHESRLGVPPTDASNRPGWHPRNAPWGGGMSQGNEHLSSVRTRYLTERAELMGLQYAHFRELFEFTDLLTPALTPRPLTVLIDARWLLALLALLCLCGAYLVSFWDNHKQRRYT